MTRDLPPVGIEQFLDDIDVSNEEKYLLAKVLRQAFDDIRGSNAAEARSAMKWARSDSLEEFSLVYICDHLGLALSEVRKRLLDGV